MLQPGEPEVGGWRLAGEVLAWVGQVYFGKFLAFSGEFGCQRRFNLFGCSARRE